MNSNNITIRPALESEINIVYEIEKSAFETESEAKLVTDLMGDPTAEPRLSLLAFLDNKPVGHILFTKMTLEGHEEANIQLLAPLAISPEAQSKGIGGMLISEGARILKEQGCDIIFVLGHPTYYPKHGFINDAKKFGFHTTHPIPEKDKDAWMLMELKEGVIKKYAGRTICAEQLDKDEYWRE